MIRRIKIMGPLPDDYEPSYYSEPDVVRYNEACHEYITTIHSERPMETNTVRIFELSNAIEQYEKIMSRMKIIAILLGANKRVRAEYQNLIDEINKLKQESRILYTHVEEYSEGIRNGGYLYLDTGHEEAKKRFYKALKPKKSQVPSK